MADSNLAIYRFKCKHEFGQEVSINIVASDLECAGRRFKALKEKFRFSYHDDDKRTERYLQDCSVLSVEIDEIHAVDAESLNNNPDYLALKL